MPAVGVEVVEEVGTEVRVSPACHAMPAVGVEVAQAGHTERLSAAQWCHPPCVVRDQAKSIVQWYYLPAMVMPQPGHTL